MLKNLKSTEKIFILSAVSGPILGFVLVFTFSYILGINLKLVEDFSQLLSLIYQHLPSFITITSLFSLGAGAIIYLLVAQWVSLKQKMFKKGLHEIIINAMTSSLVVFNENGEITTENNSFKKAFNPWGKNSIHTTLPHTIISNLFSENRLIDTEVLVYDFVEEREIHYSYSCKPFSFDIGSTKEKRWILTLRNIEKQYEEEKLINQQMSSIEASSRLTSLGEMASGFAHEINNPLSVIAANNLIIKRLLRKIEIEQDLTEKFDKLTGSVDQTVLRISKIITSLRNLAKDNSNEELEKVSIADLMEEVSVLAKVKLYSTGIDFAVESEGFEKLGVSCNKSSMTQVFMNLINNSIDATKKMDEKWIKIKFLDKNDQVDIIVTDSGKGIAPDVAEKIFQPMFTTKDFGQGMGLGLSIAHSIVEKMKGDLVYKTDGPNTSFVITLNKYDKDSDLTLKESA